MTKYKRVNFPRNIEVCIDGGMTPVRAVFDHEVLMSFWDDDGAEGFHDWWHDVGAAAFQAWMAAQGRA